MQVLEQTSLEKALEASVGERNDMDRRGLSFRTELSSTAETVVALAGIAGPSRECRFRIWKAKTGRAAFDHIVSFGASAPSVRSWREPDLTDRDSRPSATVRFVYSPPSGLDANAPSFEPKKRGLFNAKKLGVKRRTPQLWRIQADREQTRQFQHHGRSTAFNRKPALLRTFWAAKSLAENIVGDLSGRGRGTGIQRSLAEVTHYARARLRSRDRVFRRSQLAFKLAAPRLMVSRLGPRCRFLFCVLPVHFMRKARVITIMLPCVVPAPPGLGQEHH